MQDTHLQSISLNIIPDNSGLSVTILEEAFQVRLEAFALNNQTLLELYQQKDLETLQEQLELRKLQLRFLCNELSLLQMFE